MANVNGSVSIRQSRCNRISFGLCHDSILLSAKYEIIYCLPEHSRMIYFPLFVAIFTFKEKVKGFPLLSGLGTMLNKAIV
jgi:hypothetical protein